MTDLVSERLSGCNAESLDSYLRGLGFFLLAGKIEPAMRAWWNENAVLCTATPKGVEALARRLVSELLDDRGSLVTPIKTPWRGSGRAGRLFVELRNEAADEELDWFDACALPRGEQEAGTQRSDKSSNPLLLQGGQVRIEFAAAHEEALKSIRGSAKSPDLLASTLLACLNRDALPRGDAKKISVSKKVLGAYQSGRGTGPGHSARDVEPTSQPAASSAWDVLLAMEALCAFRGTVTRRPGAQSPPLASFPLLVRSRPVALRRGDALDLREDSADAFELLAPVWNRPCSARTLTHLLAKTRLRTPSGIARDTLDAALVQASRAAHGLGFDRLVRFAFISSGKMPYATRRGTLAARAVPAARRALDEVTPFLHGLDRAVREEPPSLTLARRRLDDTLGALAVGAPVTSPEERARVARQVQNALVALALLEVPAARACPDQARSQLGIASLQPSWLWLSDDGSAAFRLARALVTARATDRSSWLRGALRSQRFDDRSQHWILDPKRSVADLERAGDPLRALVEAALAAMRSSSEDLWRSTASRPARLDDVALLLSGQLGPQEERRLALLVAALAGVETPSSTPPVAMIPNPARAGIGADIGRLLLASSAESTNEEAQPRHEPAADRKAQLVSLALAGHLDALRVAADRELRRRQLDLLPRPPFGARRPADATRLALALLFPLDEATRSALEVAITVSSPPQQLEGGST